MDLPISRTLLMQLARRPFSRALPNAGKSIPAKIPMIAITTNISINVKLGFCVVKNFFISSSLSLELIHIACNRGYTICGVI